MEKGQMVGMRKKMEWGIKVERVKCEGMISCKAFILMVLSLVYNLFVSVIDVVILQLFALLKAPIMTCFK
jgi:hypothetical protein